MGWQAGTPPRVTRAGMCKPPLGPPSHAWNLLSFSTTSPVCALLAVNTALGTRTRSPLCPRPDTGNTVQRDWGSPHRPAAPDPGHVSVSRTHLRPRSSSQRTGLRHQPRSLERVCKSKTHSGPKGGWRPRSALVCATGRGARSLGGKLGVLPGRCAQGQVRVPQRAHCQLSADQAPGLQRATPELPVCICPAPRGRREPSSPRGWGAKDSLAGSARGSLSVLGNVTVAKASRMHGWLPGPS